MLPQYRPRKLGNFCKNEYCRFQDRFPPVSSFTSSSLSTVGSYGSGREQAESYEHRKHRLQISCWYIMVNGQGQDEGIRIRSQDAQRTFGHPVSASKYNSTSSRSRIAFFRKLSMYKTVLAVAITTAMMPA